MYVSGLHSLRPCRKTCLNIREIVEADFQRRFRLSQNWDVLRTLRLSISLTAASPETRLSGSEKNQPRNFGIISQAGEAILSLIYSVLRRLQL